MQFFISSLSSVIFFSVTWFSLFFQLFPLLLDCLTFELSYSPPASCHPRFDHLDQIDHLDQLSMFCRAIVWDDIVLGSNKEEGKLSGSNYVKAIYLGSIINGQFSGWQLFGGNYQWSIILWDNSLGAKYPGGNCPGSNYPGGIVWGAIIWGAIVRGTIIQGAVVLFPNATYHLICKVLFTKDSFANKFLVLPDTQYERLLKPY